MTLSELAEMIREGFASMKGSAALSAEITALKSEVSDLKTKLADSDTRVAELANEKAVSEADVTSYKAEAETAKLAAESAKAAATAAEKKAQDLIEDPSKVVLELAAKSGVKPQDRPKDEKATNKTATREQFDAMSPREKTNFAVNGGRIA